ncbi:hypothetical protein [Saccharospirillum sp.]|uniref:hypothetical protein n=1 Tax=Saccharospirillum sp. TaxID=2033801 RepID=UPI0034A04AD9
MTRFRQAWLCFALLVVTPLAFAEDFGVANWEQSTMMVCGQEQRPNLTPLITQQLAWKENQPHHQIIYHTLDSQDLSNTETSPY